MRALVARSHLFSFCTAALVLIGMFASAAVAQIYAGTPIFTLTPPTGFTNGFLSAQPQAANSGQIAGAGVVTASGDTHAVLWPGPNLAAIDLNPTVLFGFVDSFVQATNGSQQVGQGVALSTSGNTHALLWSDTAASAVDLNPTVLSGITVSQALGLSASQQVGFGSGTGTSGNNHALLWAGTAASAIDLNPTLLSGFGSSEAINTNATNQVGYAILTATTASHAMLWSGSAATAVDLNPALLGSGANSQANGVGGSQQVGFGFGTATSFNQHALLWTGSAASAIDLNPAGFGQSFANGTNGSLEVGEGDNNALLWSGTAASAVDLQSLLPGAGSWTTSSANSIDNSGIIYGSANGTFNGVTATYGIEWFPTVSWSAAVSGNWSTSNKWNNSTLPTTTLGATFNTQSANPYSVTLTSNTNVNSLNVLGDKVTIQKSGNNLAVANGVTISGTTGHPATLALSGAGTDTIGALNINSTGQLDLTDNALVINYGAGNASPISTIAAYVATGYNGGTFTGAGITSSKVASVNAAHNNSHLYAIGYADASDPAVASQNFTPGTVVIEPALVGDANLDGKVTFSDFLLFSASFNNPNTTWDQGDFNFAGITNFTDFLLLASNFNNSTSLDNADLSALVQFALSNNYRLTPNADGFGFSATAIPEPILFPPLTIALSAFLLTRRRLPAKG